MNILLIENSRKEAALLREALFAIKGVSIRVEHADRLSAAYSRLDEGGIDAILMDLYLPDCSGLETLARVQARVPEVPVVIMTRMAHEKLAILGVQKGAQDYIVKDQCNGAAVYRSLCYARERKRMFAGLEARITERTIELAVANQDLKRDIADRKQVEAVLRESEQRFHTMADTAPVLIWMSGLDKLCTYFNQVWFNYTGRTKEQERGSGWADGVHPEDFDRCLKTYTEAFDRREPFQMEYRLRKADGQYGWLLDHGVPRFLPNGEFAGYIGSCIDLTEQKDLEDRLRKAVKEKESLLREIHHRVKNNLQMISSLLNLQVASIKDPQVVQLFRECQTRITSIALLHETLHRSNDLSCIKMSNYLRTLAGHVSRSYGVDPKAIILDLLVEDLTLDTDTAMTCGMIVEELLSNSLKHAYAVAKEGRIQIELQAQNAGAYLLQVSDDGVGISKDRVRRNPGSLGLELVNLLVEKLEGAVELQSGPGTTWRIAFHQLHYQERM